MALDSYEVAYQVIFYYLVHSSNPETELLTFQIFRQNTASNIWNFRLKIS